MINKQRLVKLLQKTISINSVNPPGNELELSNYIEKDMRSLGAEVKTYSYAKNRPNVVAILKGSYPRGRAQKEAILITPHHDTVPFGNGWKFKPLGGQISQGKVYGRGASDDKGNLASCMEVVRSLVEDGVKLKKDLIMASTVDEESGSHYGIIPLLEKKVLKPAVALVMDSTEFDAVISQKGVLFLRFQIFGKKAHSAYNWRGISAIEQAAQAVVNLKNIKFLSKKHPLLRPPTINMGVIHGGDKVNMVADFCEFTVDHRFLPGMDYRQSLKLIKQAVEKVTKNYKLLIDDHQHPYEIKPNHPSVRLFMDVSKRLRSPGKLKGSEGATVITHFQKHKIPSFATGWGAHGTLHANDEYIYIDSLYKGTKLLEQYIKEYDHL